MRMASCNTLPTISSKHQFAEIKTSAIHFRDIPHSTISFTSLQSGSLSQWPLTLITMRLLRRHGATARLAYGLTREPKCEA
jgi:hypothetical protein